LGREEAE
jgi:hypothetical protein